MVTYNQPPVAALSRVDIRQLSNKDFEKGYEEQPLLYRWYRTSCAQVYLKDCLTGCIRHIFRRIKCSLNIQTINFVLPKVLLLNWINIQTSQGSRAPSNHFTSNQKGTTNQSQATTENQNLGIPSGSYSQFRIMGQGYLDDDEDLTQLQLAVRIKSIPTPSTAMTPAGSTTNELQPFDLFIFASTEEFECYLKALKVLDQNIHLNCSFLSNSNQSYLGLYEFQYNEKSFLIDQHSHKELLFVLDNTGFPLFNPQTDEISNYSTSQQEKSDLKVQMSYLTAYNTNNNYYYLFVIFSIISLLLAFFLVGLVLRFLEIYGEYRKLKEQRDCFKVEELRVRERKINESLMDQPYLSFTEQSGDNLTLDGSRYSSVHQTLENLRGPKPKSLLFKQ